MLILFLPAAYLDQRNQCCGTTNNIKCLKFLFIPRESSPLSYCRTSWPFMCNCWLSILPAVPILLGANDHLGGHPFVMCLKNRYFIDKLQFKRLEQWVFTWMDWELLNGIKRYLQSGIFPASRGKLPVTVLDLVFDTQSILLGSLFHYKHFCCE